MTKRKRKELQRSRSKYPLTEGWENYLIDISMQDEPYARIVAGALEDPDDCHISWFQEAVKALELCRKWNSYVWRKYVKYLQGKGNPLYYEDIRAALSNYRRHTKTGYDEYLRITKDKDTARALSNGELEWLGLPKSRTKKKGGSQ